MPRRTLKPSIRIDRRKFLTVLGATGGGRCALSGCSTEPGREAGALPGAVGGSVPGVATWYASTCTECAAGCGVHVRTREGRAVKLEGNPEHPVNQGKLCSRGQAALQGLYNPGPDQGARWLRDADGSFKEITWDDAIARLAAKVGAAARWRSSPAPGGAPSPISSPSGPARSAAGSCAGSRSTTSRSAPPTARCSASTSCRRTTSRKAKYILSFGADFLETWLGPIENQRGFAESHGFAERRRRPSSSTPAPRMDLTGLNADEWLAVRPGTETALALAMANVVAGGAWRQRALAAALARFTPAMAAQETGIPAGAIERLAQEFAAAQPEPRGGRRHRRAACRRDRALRRGQPAQLRRRQRRPDGPVRRRSRRRRRLRRAGAAGAAIDGGQVARAAGARRQSGLHPAQGQRASPSSSQKVPFKVSTSLFLDETAALCDLLLPQHHALERWDDLRPRAGCWSLMQPVMEPVFNTLRRGRHPAPGGKKAGGALAKFNAPS